MLTEQQQKNLLEKLKTCLAENKDAFNIEVNEQQQQDLISYLALLVKWNAAYNLTAIRDVEEMFTKHLLDSLVVAQHVKENTAIDVGTGAGLPGIPLAIIYPEKNITLLDSNGKKTRFLEHVKLSLKIANITVINSRVEKVDNQSFDAVISRGFTSLDNMVGLCEQLCNEDGVFYAMKGSDSAEEIQALQNAYQVIETIKLDVPNLDAERHLIKIQKRK